MNPRQKRLQDAIEMLFHANHASDVLLVDMAMKQLEFLVYLDRIAPPDLSRIVNGVDLGIVAMAEQVMESQKPDTSVAIP